MEVQDEIFLVAQRDASSKKWVVYLVRCADGSLYCGVTNDITRRLEAHNKGRGAKYTRSRRPVELVAVSPRMSKGAALQLEYRVKQQPVDKKVFELTDVEKHRIVAGLEKKLTLFQKDIKKIRTMLETVLKNADIVI